MNTAGFSIYLGPWREILTFKEGTEPGELDMSTAIRWVATALGLSPHRDSVVSVGTSRRPQQIILILPKDEQPTPKLIGGKIGLLDESGVYVWEIAGEVVRNFCTFPIDDLALLEQANCLELVYESGSEDQSAA